MRTDRQVLFNAAIDAVRRAGKRVIKASEKGRVAQRNARGEMLRAIRLLKLAADELCGKIKPAGTSCPLCRVPARSWVVLARHIASKHCRKPICKCPCGFRPEPCGSAKRCWASLAAHMRGQADLAHHLKLAMLRKAGV